MDQRFWESRWAENSIAFHRKAASPGLERHAAVFPAGSRILVPLCGKSLDLVWLSQHGHSVVGIEFVEQAVVDFFSEQGLRPARDGERWSSGSIAINRADIFALELSALGPFGGIWDRAAMIAFESPSRRRYTERLRQIVASGATLLLETFAYESPTMRGPPFSVEPGEVRAAYAGFRIEIVGEEDLIRTEPRLIERGVRSAAGTTWAIRA
jgi:thiopurine S-methyltransferase